MTGSCSLKMSTLPVVPSDDVIESKIRYFSDVQLWPRRARIDVKGWLNNFRAAERSMARNLLNAFIFLSDEITRQIFVSAVHRLSYDIVRLKVAHAESRAEWGAFLGSVLVIPVPGERPHMADSGHLFARFSRDQIGIHPDRIMSAVDGLKYLFNHGAMPVLFVDDFVGSGNQFVTMWQRPIEIGGRMATFQEFARNNPKWKPFYSPVLCTQTGYTEIESQCPAVLVRPGNMLPAQYSALAPDSCLWPDELRGNAEGFLRDVSIRAGIPDALGDADDWRGYQSLALAVGFDHGFPDATLPLFRWNRNGWRPLFRN